MVVVSAWESEGGAMKCEMCGEESEYVIQVTDHTELFDGAYCPECLRGALPAESVGPETEKGE